MGLIPKGWLDYDRIGKQIPGTKFIAFKVPLKENANKGNNVPPEHQLHPRLLVELIPNLGLIIDLTNTAKYYSPKDFESRNVAHVKILTEGKQIPNIHCYKKFREAVKEFYNENENNDKLIGVHCTHGLNRTGFLVCRYMIEELKIPPTDAIAAFETARGHQMKYDDFKEQLKRYNYLPSLAIDSHTEKGTQTNDGYWVCESRIRHPNNYQDKARRANNDLQVNLTGCVNVEQADLIPDGRGGFFVHVRKGDIRPRAAMPPRSPHSSSNEYYRPVGPPTLLPQQPYPMNNPYRGPMPSHSSGGQQPPSQSYRPNFLPQQRRYHNSRPMNDEHMPEHLLNRQQQHRRNFDSNGSHHTHLKRTRKY